MIFLLGIGLLWYFGIFNESVETIDKLIGKNYDYARTKYFKREADGHYTINVKHELHEIDRGILNSNEILSDSIVQVYTWSYYNHKKTIWVGQTSKIKNLIIDAIRYKNDVRF
jgi:hypothetical protein